MTKCVDCGHPLYVYRQRCVACRIIHRKLAHHKCKTKGKK